MWGEALVVARPSLYTGDSPYLNSIADKSALTGPNEVEYLHEK